MDAKKRSSKTQNGQSLLEFALLLPIMTGMVMLLVQINMAINVSIVNQKYTRNHLYHLFFNHPYYPELGQLQAKDESIAGRFWIGMDRDVAPNERPIPHPISVRVGTLKARNEDDPESKKKQNVRIMVTSFTCVAPFGLKFKQPFAEGFLEEDSFSSSNKILCAK